MYKCKDYLNSKDYNSPKLNNFITNNKYPRYYLDYITIENTN